MGSGEGGAAIGGDVDFSSDGGACCCGCGRLEVANAVRAETGLG